MPNVQLSKEYKIHAFDFNNNMINDKVFAVLIDKKYSASIFQVEVDHGGINQINDKGFDGHNKELTTISHEQNELNKMNHNSNKTAPNKRIPIKMTNNNELIRKQNERSNV